MIKKIGVIALTCSILFTGAVYADDKTVFEEDWAYSFEQEKEWLSDLGLNDEAMKALENLFNEAVEKDTDQAWQAYDDYLENLLPAFEEEFNLEEEKAWLKELGLSDQDISKIEVLYNEIRALEDAGKDDEADKKYEELELLFDKLLPFEAPTFAEEKEWLIEIGVSDADMITLEHLFNEAIALEEAGKEDEAEKKWVEFENILEQYFDDIEFTFAEEKEWLKEIGVSDADMVTLEHLFNEAIALEEAGKEDEADKKWQAFYDLLDKYEDAFEGMDDFTFAEEKEWLSEIGVSDVDMANLEHLFNEAMDLYEQDKEDEADLKWEAYDDILEKYIDIEDEE